MRHSLTTSTSRSAAATPAFRPPRMVLKLPPSTTSALWRAFIFCECVPLWASMDCTAAANAIVASVSRSISGAGSGASMTTPLPITGGAGACADSSGCGLSAFLFTCSKSTTICPSVGRLPRLPRRLIQLQWLPLVCPVNGFWRSCVGIFLKTSAAKAASVVLRHPKRHSIPVMGCSVIFPPLNKCSNPLLHLSIRSRMSAIAYHSFPHLAQRQIGSLRHWPIHAHLWPNKHRQFTTNPIPLLAISDGIRW